MILFAFFFNPQGDHRMAWRHPAAPGPEVFGLDYYRDLVGAAEAAKIDAVFMADHLGVWDTYPSGIAHYANPRLEPLALTSALAALTTDIGFLVTASTSYTEPYNLARTFATLDHLSRGRIGWNVVTSALAEEARNFGLDTVKAHASRYARAGEFLDVTKALWDSWEDGAVVIDKATGIFADTSKVHYIDHAGPHFRVKGPLNVPHSPQGRPVIVQAGSSEAGRDLAAAHADVHFIVAREIEEAVRYRADMNERLARNGRAPESLKLIPGVLPIVAGSVQEAADRQGQLADLMLDRVGIDLLSTWAGVDLSLFPPDGPVPDLPDPGGFEGWKTWLTLVRAEANQGLTIRELARKIANTGAVPLLAGTAKSIADELEAWVAAGAADGFNLMFPLLPDDWMAFMRDVVPELQRRGLAQRDYGPGTLRERWGLEKPANSFARG